MVHEWAHLRWGVFDETGGNGYPEFYYKDGKIEANRLIKIISKLCLRYTSSFLIHQCLVRSVIFRMFVCNKCALKLDKTKLSRILACLYM